MKKLIFVILILLLFFQYALAETTITAVPLGVSLTSTKYSGDVAAIVKNGTDLIVITFRSSKASKMSEVAAWLDYAKYNQKSIRFIVEKSKIKRKKTNTKRMFAIKASLDSNIFWDTTR
jgi:hypothetical protein